METQTEQIENGVFVTDYKDLCENSWKILTGRKE
jgi:hypothetical protein